MSLSSAEIKHQILKSSERSEIKKKIDANRPPGISDGEYIEMGNELEKVTKMVGWTLIESYMIRRMNLVGLVFTDDEKNRDQKGLARGYIELMQWIDVTIQKKNDIIESERKKYETENVQKDEGKSGI